MKELRVKNDETKKEKCIEGHAAVFNQWSEKLGSRWFSFREKILPGSFTESIQQDDVRALINHDPNLILGRNKSNTLELSEDNIGLKVRIVPPDTQYARDLMVSIDRGDITQMSFMFEVLSDRWGSEEGIDADEVREISKVKLYDVSPVTFPAYPQTDVGTRSAMDISAARLEEKRELEIKRKEQFERKKFIQFLDIND